MYIYTMRRFKQCINYEKTTGSERNATGSYTHVYIGDVRNARVHGYHARRVR